MYFYSQRSSLVEKTAQRSLTWIWARRKVLVIIFMGRQCKSSVANSKVGLNTEFHFIFQFWNYQSHLKHSREESDGYLLNTGITLFLFFIVLLAFINKCFKSSKITSNWICLKWFTVNIISLHWMTEKQSRRMCHLL